MCGNKYSSKIKLELHLQIVHNKEATKKATKKALSIPIEATSLPSSRALPLSKKCNRTSLQPSVPTLISSLPSKLPCLPLPPLPSTLHPPCCTPCPGPSTTPKACTGDCPTQAGRHSRAWRKMWSRPGPPSKSKEQKEDPWREAGCFPHQVIQGEVLRQQILRQKQWRGERQGAGQGSGKGAGQEAAGADPRRTRRSPG